MSVEWASGKSRAADTIARLRWRHLLPVAIFVTGLVFFGNGVWIKAKAAVAQVLLDHAFLASVSNGGKGHKPWGWADIEPVARISAPRLAEQNIVLDNVSGEALAFGPGHLPGSAQPGEPGTAVYSAHRDTHFRWLGELQSGDLVNVETRDGKVFSYEIKRAWVARYDAPGIDRNAPGNRIALTTCWPLDATLRSEWRYVVEGVQVEGEAKAATSHRSSI